jgi:SAM-dependent methyltransferase
MQAAAPPEQLQQSKDEMESACTPRAGGEVDTGVDGWNSSTIHEQTERAASADELIKLYTQWGAATYDEEMDAHDLASYKSVTAKALEFWAADATSGDVRVLDAGCGTGILGAYFRKHTAIPGLHLSGLDLVPALLERAEAKGSYQFLTPGSLLEDLPFPADHFDQIVSSGVFMPGHVGAEAITNIMRVLKPGKRRFLLCHPRT